MPNRVITTGLLFLALNGGCAAATAVPSVRPTVSVPAYDRTVYETPPTPPPISRLNLRGQNGETVAPLTTGQPAPYTGVLFNGSAVAALEVQFAGLQQQCVIERVADHGRLGAMAISDIERMRSAYTTLGQQSVILLDGRDAEINRLQHTPNFTPWLWALGGVAFGVGAFSTIYLLVR